MNDTRPLAVLGLSLYGPVIASHRVRLAQFQPGLASQGIDLQVQSLLQVGFTSQPTPTQRLSLPRLIGAARHRLQLVSLTHRFDLAIVYAELLPLLPAWLEQRLLRLPYILDLDDAFYLKYRSGRLGWLRPLLGRKIDRLIAGAAAITAGNSHLSAYAHQFNANVTLLPSVVDTERYRPADNPPVPHFPPEPFTVGWIGSPSTAPYLSELVQPLRRLAIERPVRLLVIGGRAPAIEGVEVIEMPWSLATEVDQIRRFDVGVMPLPPTPWAEGKCAYKLIQCMACAVPVVASAVGANIAAVPPACGLLARTPEAWLQAFRILAGDPDLRRRVGLAGRCWVEEHYSLSLALPVLTGLIRQVASPLV